LQFVRTTVTQYVLTITKNIPGF